MAYCKGIDRHQTIQFPEVLDDYISEDNPVRFLDAFCDSIDYEGLGMADATKLPLSKSDCIVTDPPYGRSSSTMGSTTKQIVQNFLSAVIDRIEKPQICMASPRQIKVCEIADELGFRKIQSHFVHVHRSLTREIAVLKLV